VARARVKPRQAIYAVTVGVTGIITIPLLNENACQSREEKNKLEHLPQ
jgi:hypothetical protein